MSDLQNIFQDYYNEIERERSIKEEISIVVKDLEKISYGSLTVLEKIHSNLAEPFIKSVAEECEQILNDAPATYRTLEEKVPKGEFYRFHWQFKWITQRLVFVTAFVIYLQNNRLADYEEVASKLGLKLKKEDGFHLDLEDYLFGILLLSSDLARLAVNSVTSGDYSRPFQISAFMRELNSAYGLLNPKGDLRKKFDELKYSLKKTEEVVFNLTIRGLKPSDIEDKSG